MAETNNIANVLSNRYASEELNSFWSAESKIILERQLWIAVMKAQKDLGVDIPVEAIEAYEAVIDKVDLASIAARERVTRHDVKARIEEFNALAGFEHIHKGMTSRDLTENVEQLQVVRSLELIRDKAVAVVARIGERAAQYQTEVMAGRSHNVAAQATTLGKRFASAADEMLVAIERVEELLGRYPLRGIKGPMGTSQDMLDLMGGNEMKLAALETRIADHLGFHRVFDSVGQVYPRSLDFDAVSALVQLGAGPSSLATTIRLMAGNAFFDFEKIRKFILYVNKTNVQLAIFYSQAIQIEVFVESVSLAKQTLHAVSFYGRPEPFFRNAYQDRNGCGMLTFVLQINHSERIYKERPTFSKKFFNSFYSGYPFFFS